MQEQLASPQFWNDRTTAKVNGVDVYYGEEAGVFIPDSDPQGGKRPFVVVPKNCPMSDIQNLTGRVRTRYDFIRQLDGYAPMKWEGGFE